MTKFVMAGLLTLLISLPASARERTWWLGKNLGRPCPWTSKTVEVKQVKLAYWPAPACAGPACGTTIIQAANITISGTQICPNGRCPNGK